MAEINITGDQYALVFDPTPASREDVLGNVPVASATQDTYLARAEALEQQFLDELNGAAEDHVLTDGEQQNLRQISAQMMAAQFYGNNFGLYHANGVGVQVRVNVDGQKVALRANTTSGLKNWPDILKQHDLSGIYPHTDITLVRAVLTDVGLNVDGMSDAEVRDLVARLDGDAYNSVTSYPRHRIFPKTMSGNTTSLLPNLDSTTGIWKVSSGWNATWIALDLGCQAIFGQVSEAAALWTDEQAPEKFRAYLTNAMVGAKIILDENDTLEKIRANPKCDGAWRQALLFYARDVQDAVVGPDLTANKALASQELGQTPHLQNNWGSLLSLLFPEKAPNDPSANVLLDLDFIKQGDLVMMPPATDLLDALDWPSDLQIPLVNE